MPPLRLSLASPLSLSTLERRPVLFGSLLMVGASFLFAVMAIATRAATGMGAAQLVALRFAIMAVGTLLWRGPGAGAIHPNNLRLLGLRGVLGGAAGGLYFVALGRAPAAGVALQMQ